VAWVKIAARQKNLRHSGHGGSNSSANVAPIEPRVNDFRSNFHEMPVEDEDIRGKLWRQGIQTIEHGHRQNTRSLLVLGLRIQQAVYPDLAALKQRQVMVIAFGMARRQTIAQQPDAFQVIPVETQQRIHHLPFGTARLEAATD
jgi:hypothetical protein